MVSGRWSYCAGLGNGVLVSLFLGLYDVSVESNIEKSLTVFFPSSFVGCMVSFCLSLEIVTQIKGIASAIFTYFEIELSLFTLFFFLSL